MKYYVVFEAQKPKNTADYTAADFKDLASDKTDAKAKNQKLKMIQPKVEAISVANTKSKENNSAFVVFEVTAHDHIHVKFVEATYTTEKQSQVKDVKPTAKVDEDAKLAAKVDKDAKSIAKVDEDAKLPGDKSPEKSRWTILKAALISGLGGVGIAYAGILPPAGSFLAQIAVGTAIVGVTLVLANLVLKIVSTSCRRKQAKALSENSNGEETVSTNPEQTLREACQLIKSNIRAGALNVGAEVKEAQPAAPKLRRSPRLKAIREAALDVSAKAASPVLLSVVPDSTAKAEAPQLKRSPRLRLLAAKRSA